jgi:hypothetical protein
MEQAPHRTKHLVAGPLDGPRYERRLLRVAVTSNEPIDAIADGNKRKPSADQWSGYWMAMSATAAVTIAPSPSFSWIG